MSNRIGQVISDRYVLAELIGSGGHSHVFRAIDRSGGPNVAIKILQDELAGSEEHAVRLVREHRVMTLLSGTAAVRVRGLATSPDGAVCVVMELLKGKDLDDALAEVEVGGRRMSLERVLGLLEPVVGTLERAHDQGIVHRDVKPGNIYVMDGDDAPGVRLIDFMLARLDRARPLTKKGIIIGSPSYIAPEAWAGDSRATDHRMDVYSFGAIVFRCLAGRVPFDAPTLKDKVDLITSGPRPSLHELRPELPRGVDAWVGEVLAIDPNRRFQRMTAAWTALLETVAPATETREVPA